MKIAVKKGLFTTESTAPKTWYGVKTKNLLSQLLLIKDNRFNG